MFGGISRSYPHSHFHTPASFGLVRRGYGLMCNAVSVVPQHKGRVRSNAVIKSSLRPNCVYSTTFPLALCRQNLIISASAPVLVARAPLSLRSAPATRQPALRWKSDDGTTTGTNDTSRSPSNNNNDDNDQDDNKTIHVKGLPWRAGEDEIRDFFLQNIQDRSGNVVQIVSLNMPLQDDGRSSGTAVITFSSNTAAAAAIELNQTDFSGRRLKIKYSTPRVSTPKPDGCVTVFVGNLSWNVTEDALYEVFGECGEISQVRLAKDRETGRLKGFGYVEFFDTASTDKAITMDGTDIMGRPVWVDFDGIRGGGGSGGRGFGGGGGGSGGSGGGGFSGGGGGFAGGNSIKA